VNYPFNISQLEFYDLSSSDVRKQKVFLLSRLHGYMKITILYFIFRLEVKNK